MNPALSNSGKNTVRKGAVKVLIAAGGSGGHIFPAVALSRKLKTKAGDINILFLGSGKGLDRRIFEKESLSFSLLSKNKFPHDSPLALPAFFVRLAYDTVRAFFIISSYRPDVVVGFGGYVSCPAVFAACLFGIPKIAHEQNVTAGRANKFLFKLADKIAISFEETKKFMGHLAGKAVLTGNPIRTEDFNNDREAGVRSLGLDPAKFTILVIGGSQGAHFLNKTFIEALSGLGDSLKRSLQIIHLTGIKDYEWALNGYEGLGLEHRVYSFIDRIEEAYSACDLIITRSGASAIFEIAYFAKPMILIPYPYAMSHQAANARAFSKEGAAIEMDEQDLTAEKFRVEILDLMNDRARLRKLAESARRLSMPDAAERLADLILQMAKCPSTIGGRK